MTKKIILSILLAIGVLIVGAIVYVSLNINSIIKQGIETAGPKVTKTEVRLGSSNVSIFSGEGTLSNLFIGNPKGFTSPSVFELGSISMAIDTDSIAADVIRVKNIAIKAPRITLEVKEKTTNVKELMKNVRSFSAGEGKASAQKDGGKEVKMIINELLITEGAVKILVPQIKQEAKSDLPDIRLKDIGKDKNGVTVGEVSLIVMEELEKAISQSSANPLDEMRSKFGAELGGKEAELTDKIKKKAGDLGDTVKGWFK